MRKRRGFGLVQALVLMFEVSGPRPIVSSVAVVSGYWFFVHRGGALREDDLDMAEQEWMETLVKRSV